MSRPPRGAVAQATCTGPVPPLRERAARREMGDPEAPGTAFGGGLGAGFALQLEQALLELELGRPELGAFGAARLGGARGVPAALVPQRLLPVAGGVQLVDP